MKINNLDIACLSTRCGTPTDGYDYDCEYEQSGEISCDDCVCNYGHYHPKTGKRISWLLRVIQNRRAIKHYKAVQKYKQHTNDTSRID